MKTESEKIETGDHLDTLIQDVFCVFENDREYPIREDLRDGIFCLDEKNHFLLLAKKEESSDHYIVACKEIDRESADGFEVYVFTTNGGGACKELFLKKFPMPPDFTIQMYGQIRAEAGRLAEKFKYSDHISDVLEELK